MNKVDEMSAINIGSTLFRFRDYTPIPLILLLLLVSQPTVLTATLGLVMIFFGELIRIYSVAFIGSISRTRKGSLGDKLIKEGPFAYVRNPLYVGNFFISFGVSVFSGNIYLMFLTAALFAFQYFYIVSYEESLLSDKFGSEFDDYRREVPAWFPIRSFKLDAIAWPDSFSGALRSEKKTLLAILGVVTALILAS